MKMLKFNINGGVVKFFPEYIRQIRHFPGYLEIDIGTQDSYETYQVTTLIEYYEEPKT